MKKKVQKILAIALVSLIAVTQSISPISVKAISTNTFNQDVVKTEKEASWWDWFFGGDKEDDDEPTPTTDGINTVAPFTGNTLVAVNTNDTEGASSENTGAVSSVDKNVISVNKNVAKYDDLGRKVIDTNSVLANYKVAPKNIAGLNLSYSAPMNTVATANYRVGDTRSLSINASSTVESRNFEVMSVGTHCNVWAPVRNDGFKITKAEANNISNEFDKVYGEMGRIFGTPTSEVDLDRDGKINVVCYDIDNDGAAGVNSYVGGYFYGYDLYNSNKLDIIHIDAAQGMYKSASNPNSGNVKNCFGTLVHEYQHLIHFGYTGGNTPTYINEAFSEAATYLIYDRYKDDFVSSRIRYYNMSKALKQGSVSLTNDWGGSDVLSNYSLIYLFGQYIRTQYSHGETIYKDFLMSEGQDLDEIANLLNVTSEDVVSNFYVALAAKESKGKYGFNGEEWINGLKVQYTTANSVRLPAGAAVYFGEHSDFTPSNAGKNIKFTSIAA